MKTLFSQFVGELGWELFGWQGYLREISQDFDKVILSGRYNHEIIHEDFCDEYIPINVSGSCKGPYNSDYIYDNLHEKYAPDLIILPQTQLIKYNLQNRQNFIDFKQKFIKYGNSDNSFDFLIHPRNVSFDTFNNSVGRNWSLEKWKDVIKHFPNLKIASIGSKEGAAHIPGTIDLRGVSLRDLVNYMAGSKFCIGPSSGPMHLASLCGCQQVVWWGKPEPKKRIQLNEYRYLEDWNPFKTKVKIVSQDTFDIEVKQLITGIMELF